MHKVYGDILSGNCYKVKLLMSLLGIEHEWIHVDILAGEARTDAFTAMNPVGKVPTLELADGGFDLSQYPAVDTWLDTVASQPGHMTMAQFGAT